MVAPFLTKMFRAVVGGNIVVTATLIILGTVMIIVGRFVDPTLKQAKSQYTPVRTNVSARTGAMRYVALTLVVLGTVLVLIGLLPYAILSIRLMYAKA